MKILAAVFAVFLLWSGVAWSQDDFKITVGQFVQMDYYQQKNLIIGYVSGVIVGCYIIEEPDEKRPSWENCSFLEKTISKDANEIINRVKMIAETPGGNNFSLWTYLNKAVLSE